MYFLSTLFSLNIPNQWFSLKILFLHVISALKRKLSIEIVAYLFKRLMRLLKFFHMQVKFEHIYATFNFLPS